MNTIQQAASRLICAAALGTLLLPSAYAEMSTQAPGKPPLTPIRPPPRWLPRPVPPRRLPRGACHGPPGDAKLPPLQPPVRLNFLSLRAIATDLLPAIDHMRARRTLHSPAKSPNVLGRS